MGTKNAKPLKTHSPLTSDDYCYHNNIPVTRVQISDSADMVAVRSRKDFPSDMGAPTCLALDHSQNILVGFSDHVQKFNKNFEHIDQVPTWNAMCRIRDRDAGIRQSQLSTSFYLF